MPSEPTIVRERALARVVGCPQTGLPAFLRELALELTQEPESTSTLCLDFSNQAPLDYLTIQALLVLAREHTRRASFLSVQGCDAGNRQRLICSGAQQWLAIIEPASTDADPTGSEPANAPHVPELSLL